MYSLSIINALLIISLGKSRRSSPSVSSLTKRLSIDGKESKKQSLPVTFSFLTLFPTPAPLLIPVFDAEREAKDGSSKLNMYTHSHRRHRRVGMRGKREKEGKEERQRDWVLEPEKIK